MDEIPIPHPAAMAAAAGISVEQFIADWSAVQYGEGRMRAHLMKACEYCGGPSHAIGLCHAVAAVEYRNGETVKRVEFNRSAPLRAPDIDWLDVRTSAKSSA